MTSLKVNEHPGARDVDSEYRRANAILVLSTNLVGKPSMRILFLALLPLAFFGEAIADDEVGIANAPEWSESHAIKDFSKDRTGLFQNGIAYLLSDRQVRKTDIGYDYVQRFAYRVVDRTGLESAAKISRLFDPSNEDLSFNFVRVIRGGEVLDRLSDTEITVLRQEEGLENSLIDGSLTALIQLEDVRVGDTIDYSLSVSVESKLWPDELFDTASVEWSEPIAQSFFFLQAPDDVEVYFRGVSTNVEPEITSEKGWTSYKLYVVDPDPVRIEESVPYDLAQTGFVAFTTMRAWSDVVAWAKPLYIFDDALPDDFARKLDNIAKTYPRAQDRALHALRLIQEDVRYLGIEVGLGSHVPRPPKLTLERGYGDCKDKSVLLVSALDYLGVKATPALASLSVGDMLHKFPPSIGAFDHVIVELEIDDQKFWVDPTLSHQGGTMEDLADLRYGYVLPIHTDQADLVKIEEILPKEPTFEIQESYDFPDTDGIGMALSVTYIYREALANWTRVRIANQGKDNWARNFLDFYAAKYEGLVESVPLTITDELDANTVVLSVGYTVDSKAFEESDYRDELPVFPSAVQDVLPRQLEANRSAPLRLPLGSHAQHTILIQMDGQKFRLPDNFSKSVGGINYVKEFDDDAGTFVLVFKLAVIEQTAELADAKAVTELADDIAADSEWSIRRVISESTSASSLGLDTPLDPATNATVARIDQSIDEKKYVEALTSLNLLIAKHSEETKLRGFLLLKKAKLLVSLGRQKAALKPFREAFAVYSPPDADSYYKYMSLLRKLDLDSDIVPVIIQLRDNDPQAIEALNKKWLGRLYFDLRKLETGNAANELALAVARAYDTVEIKDIEDTAWLFYGAVEELAKRGEIDEATNYLSHLKDPRAFARLLTNKETESIWGSVEEKTGKNLSHAISDYVTYTNLMANLSPGDYSALHRHVKALRMAGKPQKAIAFADFFIDNWARIEAVGKDAYWFVNNTAYALSDAGRKDEAIALMTRLVDLGVRENGSLVSMAINRASILMQWQEFEAALKAAEELESISEGTASEYGKMWIYSIKACSLHQLGQTEDAMIVLNESILPIAEKNAAAHTMTLLCLNRMDKAAELMVSRLQNLDDNQDTIVSFSTFAQSESTTPFFIELNRRADVVRKRKNVKEAFDKIGRSITISGASAYWGEF